jgi:outer membrane protein insertion porin family
MQGSNKKNTYGIWYLLLCIMLFAVACKPVKDVQDEKGVIKIKKGNGINVDVIGTMPNIERRDLKLLLSSQIDRKLKSKPKKVKILRLINVTRNFKANYDTFLVRRSVVSMKNALIENGYFLNTVKADTNMRKGDVVINFRIIPDKAYKVKSFVWDLHTDTFKKFTVIPTRYDSIMQLNKPFTKTKSNNELQRFITKLRNNGYYKVSGNDFRAEIDTSNIALRENVFDLEQIIEANKRAKAFYENPVLDYFIVRNKPADSNTIFKQYRIGKLTVIPDDNVKAKRNRTDTTYFSDITFVRNAKLKLSNKLIAKNVFMHKGALFSQDAFSKTFLALSKLDVWQNIKIEEKLVDTINGIIDFDLKLAPALREHIEVSVDASRNVGGSLVLGTTTLWGFGLTALYSNKNAFKSAVKSNTSITGLLEFRNANLNFGETNRQLFLKQQFIIPRLPFASWNNERNTVANSFVNFNIGLVNQIDFIRYTSIELGTGIDFRKGLSPFTFKVKPLNYEIYARKTFTDFDQLVAGNPLLLSIYRDGIIAGMQFGGSWVNESLRKRKASTRVSFNVEESGLTWGRFINNKIRFAKTDLTVVRNIITNLDKGHNLAMRLNIGFGYELDSASHALPIFRKYISGGPTSMRAWRIRSLGPGGFRSNQLSLTQTGGDIQFELNIEQRYVLPIKPFGLRYETCWFADIGNSFNNESGNFTNSSLARSTFFKNLGIAVGSGLRVDISFIKIRLDIAYKFKDPSRNTSNGFPTKFDDLSLKENKLPFTDGSTSTFRTNNYAFQFGINYPF